MNTSKPLSLGLESIALALIFAPEPVSTFIGIGLLAFARANKIKRVGTENNIKPANRFEDYYQYRIGKLQPGKITYEITPVRQGQLPGTLPRPVRLYDTQAWGHYRRTAYNYLNTKKPAEFSGMQKGLLGEINRGITRRRY